MTPKILIATQDRDRFSSLAGSLEKMIGADIYWTATGQDTLAEARRLTPILVVMDEALPDMATFDLARELLKQNALINTAVATRLSEEDFHETSEGLGVLTSLPPFPGKKEAEDIVSGLKRIFALPDR